MEMMAILLALLIPYLMVKVQPEGFITQIIFAFSLILNGLGAFITGITMSTDLLFHPILSPFAQSCIDVCSWTLVDPASTAALPFLVVMCLGGIGMLYTAITDKRYEVKSLSF